MTPISHTPKNLVQIHDFAFCKMPEGTAKILLDSFYPDAKNPFLITSCTSPYCLDKALPDRMFFDAIPSHHYHEASRVNGIFNFVHLKLLDDRTTENLNHYLGSCQKLDETRTRINKFDYNEAIKNKFLQSNHRKISYDQAHLILNHFYYIKKQNYCLLREENNEFKICYIFNGIKPYYHETNFNINFAFTFLKCSTWVVPFANVLERERTPSFLKSTAPDENFLVPYECKKDLEISTESEEDSMDLTIEDKSNPSTLEASNIEFTDLPHQPTEDMLSEWLNYNGN